MMEKYYSNGKLLITGEYTVLDGALSFALPTKFGQNLEISVLNSPVIIWESFSVTKELWFQVELKLNELSNASPDPRIATLQKILLQAKKMNPDFLNDGNGAFVQTFLSFPTNWGLGTSSTLINNIANWAKVDAFELLQKSFGGSGYDIACAQNNTAIQYQLVDDKPIVSEIEFQPNFKNQLYFVYLNQKQNSKEGIQLYRSIKENKKSVCQEISEISKKINQVSTLIHFEELLTAHEEITGNLLNITPLKESVFKDYFGAVKSLGAWGGDFVLVTGNEDTPNYFAEKGFETIVTYDEMILS